MKTKDQLPAPIVIVAALGKRTRVIGKNNQLLWHVPADLKRFKVLTLGHPIIMGRKTYESIVALLGGPLPGRTNIVVTRNADYQTPGAVVVDSLDAAFAAARAESPKEIHIGGGAELYRQALPHVDRLHLTLFEEEPEGDAYFPEFAEAFVVSQEYPPAEHQGIVYQWIDYLRK